MPRKSLHHEIRNEFSESLVKFLKDHPDQLEQPGFKDSLDALHRLMTRVLLAVDRYAIGELKQPEERRDPDHE